MKDLSNQNVIHVMKNGIQYLQFRKLLQYENYITHAYSVGIDLNFRTSNPNEYNVANNEYDFAIDCYKKVCNSLGQNYIDIVKTNQSHTRNVKIVNNKINEDYMDINLDEYKNTDGLITNKKNLILSTTNADCILMLFFDPVTKTIANIHSGWRGTLQKISVETVNKMVNEMGCKAKDIICCICPSIRKCHFEVDEDVKNLFEREIRDFSENKRTEIIEKQKDREKWNIDTVLINKILLEQIGLMSENIIDSGICSVCNSDLIHSYRVEKKGYKLSTALISLK